MGDEPYEESEVNAEGNLQRVAEGFEGEYEESRPDVAEAEEVEKSNRLACEMLAQAPARAAESYRVEKRKALNMQQHMLSTEERLAQLEKAAGLSPVVKG